MDMLTSGIVVHMSLSLLLTLSTIESDEEINKTVYIEKGSVSVDLSCGEVPQAAIAIEWFIYKRDEWVKLLKFYHNHKSKYSNSDYSKYGISEAVKTSLVVKNIELSDSALYQCGSVGGILYSHTTLLQVVVPPDFIQDDPSKDLAGPYHENVNEHFTCKIRKVLHGESSISFKFYYNSKLRLKSKNGIGEVVDRTESNGTTFMHWKFTTSFNRSDNGGNMRCQVKWNKEWDLKSIITENVQIAFNPNGMDMEIRETVKENMEQLVECKANSANPSSSVGMELLIDGTNQKEIEPEVTETPGSDNGFVKAFVFRFTTHRSQNKKAVECRLMWDGAFTNVKKEDSLNITFKPNGMDMEIREATRENREQLVECKANSANPSSSVGMELLIDGTNQKEIKPEVTETPGSDNGIVKTFLFRFTTDRSQNEKAVECHLMWDGAFMKVKREDSLNITFKPNGMDMEIREATRENREQLVECKANSANPSSSVGMELLIDGTNQKEIKPEVTETPGFDNGIVKTFLFRFTTDRSQNEKAVECHLMWDGAFMKVKREDSLNITSISGEKLPLIYVIVCPVVMFLVIEAGLTVAVFELKRRKKKKSRSQDDSNETVGVENNYQGAPKVSDYLDMVQGRNPSDYTTPSVIYGDDSSEETYGHEEILNNPLTEDDDLYMRAYQIKKQENEQRQKIQRWPPHARDSYDGSKENYEYVEPQNSPVAEDNKQVYVKSIGAQKQEDQSKKPRHHRIAGSIHGSDDRLRQDYENVDLLIRPAAQVHEQVCMKSNDAQKQKNQPKPRSRPGAPPALGRQDYENTDVLIGLVAEGHDQIYMRSNDAQKQEIQPKPRSHQAAPIAPGEDDSLGQDYEFVDPLNRPVAEDDELIYMRSNDAQKQEMQSPVDFDPSLVYADLTFQHVNPARQKAMPNNDDKVIYSTMDFDRTKACNVEDKD